MVTPKNKSIEIPKELTEVYKFVDDHKEKYLEDLRQAISIPSVSCERFRDRDLILMAEWMAEKLRSIGVTAELWEYQTASIYQPLEFKRLSTSCVEVPPIVLGYFGNDPNKKTVMFCGHYDVLPASLNDGWMSDPFKLLHKGERLYGRGVSDNKGPCIIWFNAIEAYLNIHQSLPVNIKIVIDGMDECGFAGFYNLLDLNRTFFEDVDYVVISEEQWLTSSTPCLGYSLRGFVCFSVDVECCKKDLHSGTHGGVIYEAMPDLIYLLEGLVGNNGEILIPGFYDDLAPFSLSEEKEISEVNFDVNKFKKQIGCERLLHNDKVHLLMALWRYPNLSIHAIDGVCPDSGEKTVIPKKVRGKFSIRLIPFQKSDKIIKLVKDFLDEKWKARHSYNKYELHISSSYRDWVIIPHDNHNYRSAIKATKYVYGVEPQIIRCGGSSLSLIKVHEVSNASMLSLPLSSADDCAHSQNENLEARVYFNGVKLVASYLYELSKTEDDEVSMKTETTSLVSGSKRESKRESKKESKKNKK